MARDVPRTFLTRLGDRELPIEVSAIGSGRFRVVLDGQEQTVDARRLGTRTISLLIDGRNHEVSVIRKGDEYDILISNHRFRVPLVPEAKARRAAGTRKTSAGGRKEIKASMPGKVVDVLVKVGDAVEADQGLLIVEAMKMENEIRAPGAGEVKEVCVQPGEAVEAGELLAVVE